MTPELLTPELYSSLSARESDADQAFINTRAIQFDAALATELWTYDGNTINGYAFQGGHQNDRLLGGQFRDWLDGKDGDDYIDAGAGAYLSDPVLGGNFVRGGLGSDYLLGGADTDFMSGNDFDKWALWDRANPQLTEGYLDESARVHDLDRAC